MCKPGEDPQSAFSVASQLLPRESREAILEVIANSLTEAELDQLDEETRREMLKRREGA